MTTDYTTIKGYAKSDQLDELTTEDTIAAINAQRDAQSDAAFEWAAAQSRFHDAKAGGPFDAETEEKLAKVAFAKLADETRRLSKLLRWHAQVQAAENTPDESDLGAYDDDPKQTEAEGGPFD